MSEKPESGGQMAGKYANVIIDIAHESVDHSFQYRIPARLMDELQTGMEVAVPFGAKNRSRNGYVIEITSHTQYDKDKIKELYSIVQKKMAIEGQLIQLAAWIRDRYGSTMIQALKTVLPVRDRMRQLEEKQYVLAVDEERAHALLGEYRQKKYTAKVRVLEELIRGRVLSSKIVREKLKVSPATVDALIRDGVMYTKTNQLYRNPVEEAQKEPRYHLNAAQQAVADKVHHVFFCRQKKPFLLHGVTGSGKTEVYVELAALAAKEGKSSIVLIPEIALTRQTVLRFYRQFGSRVSVLHSKLSKGERSDQFQRAKNGEIDVMIGPRSALFTPFSNLGYIIVDEEHETSYKSETIPRYHAREVAVRRAEMTGATVLLASATPSVDSYYCAMQGVYELLEMKERISKQGLADVSIVDMRRELLRGNRSVFSRVLYEQMQERLNKKQQIMLFINRRGYHGFLSCRSCGKAVKCPNCDVTLSLHNDGRMLCHYCGYEQPRVMSCPACGSKYIGGFRVGTQQVEEQVLKWFPAAKVLRMDMDTTRSKNSSEQIVTAFRKKEADILIGTQMIVKGHDFPDVTLVGILAADMSLQINDFRSAERTFQLLTQAAGRAGRGKEKGSVIIQTYNPEHYSIRLSAKQDYEGFYKEEMKFRSMMRYPPAGNVMEILVSADTESLAVQAGERIAAGIRQFCGSCLSDGGRTPVLIGPAPAAISKLNNKYRRVIYVRHEKELFLQKCRMYLERQTADEDVQIQYDMTL